MITVAKLSQGSDLHTKAYYAVKEVHEVGTPTSKTSEHVGSEVGREEIGLEHL